jgi:hypothetical protein
MGYSNLSGTQVVTYYEHWDRMLKGYNYNSDSLIGKKLVPEFAVNAKRGSMKTEATGAQEYLRVIGNKDLSVGYGDYPTLFFQMSSTTLWTLEEHGIATQFNKNDGEDWNPANPAQGMRDYGTMTAKWLRQIRELSREVEVQTIFQTAGNFGGSNKVTLTGADQWSAATADIPTQMATARARIKTVSGRLPNVLATSWLVWEKLKNHPSIKKMAYQMGNTDALNIRALTVAEVAAALELDTILVGSEQYETKKSGETSSRDWIWGKHATLAYQNFSPSPTLFDTSFCYKFRRGDEVFDSFYPSTDKGNKQEEIRQTLSEEYDIMIVDANAGYLFINAIA